jgi:hypothetical protein
VGIGAEGQWDDPTIPDREVLYRYIHPTHWVSDGESGYRLSTALMLFGSRPSVDDGLSVYSATLLAEANFEPVAILPDQTYGLASMTAGDARELKCGVRCDFSDDPIFNVAHMLIMAPGEKLTQSQRRGLSQALISKLRMCKMPIPIEHT